MKNRNSEKKENRKKPDKNKRSLRCSIMILTTVCMLVVTIGAGVLGYILMKRYENGILDVCATQQDAYVQLVLDQINLKENREDEQIITEILGTLDASSNKYWTFSRDQSMLFIKDVLETNKYKGFTTASYYVSDSAQTFLAQLQVNRVTHAEIAIGDQEFIASGVSFLYDGDTYRLCLLTDRSVLLNNNKFLGSKTELGAYIVTILLLLAIIPMVFAHYTAKLKKVRREQEGTISTLYTNLNQLNERLTDHDLHDTRTNLWKQSAIRGFLDKLRERQVTPVSVVHMHCKDVRAKQEFISKAPYTLNRNVLRFEYGEQDLVLIFVQVEMETAMQSLLPLSSKDAYLAKGYVAETQEDLDYEKIKCELGIEEDTTNECEII